MPLKRCLIGLQKGVNKLSKGHLLQANWVSFRIQLIISLFYYDDFLFTNKRALSKYGVKNLKSYIIGTRSHGGDGGKRNVKEVPTAQRTTEV